MAIENQDAGGSLPDAGAGTGAGSDNNTGASDAQNTQTTSDDPIDRLIKATDEPQAKQDKAGGSGDGEGSDGAGAAADPKTKSGGGAPKKGKEKAEGDPAKPGAAAGAGAGAAGADRRIQEQVFQERQRAERLQHDLTKVTKDYETLQGVFQQVNSYGLTAVELSEAAQFVADLKKNPQAAVTSLLASLKQSGINFDSSNSGIDAQAIHRMIRDELKPLISDREAVVAERKVYDEAKRELDQFTNDYPEADGHLEAVVEVAGKLGVSLERAWYALIREASRLTNNSSAQSTPPQNNPPLPNSGHRVDELASSGRRDRFTHESSYSDIIEDALKMHNYT